MSQATAPFALHNPRKETSIVVRERYRLDRLPDEALHTGTKTLVGRHNALTAELLAHLAEIETRGIYREHACSSLYTYCVYELRFSEDEAQRRARAARAAREFPALFEMLADGAIHMTGLLLLAPHLTVENHAELLARARFRTKREIERLIAEFAPRPDVRARIEPLGPQSAPARNLWQAYTASLAGPVRERLDSEPVVPLRYRIEFSVSQQYVDRLEEARNLLQHRIPSRDIAEIHELAVAALVEHLKKRRQAALTRRELRAELDSPELDVSTSSSAVEGSAPERVIRQPAEGNTQRKRYVPAAIRRAVWTRDEGRCTFADTGGRRCQERAGLELHHEQAFALGGPATTENLRLLCRAHNALLVERDFGRTHMERRRNGRRLE
jgi:hypothetical protein